MVAANAVVRSGKGSRVASTTHLARMGAAGWAPGPGTVRTSRPPSTDSRPTARSGQATGTPSDLIRLTRWATSARGSSCNWSGNRTEAVVGNGSSSAASTWAGRPTARRAAASSHTEAAPASSVA